MKRLIWVLACLLGGAVPRPAEAQSSDVARFAIVIGNNRPEKPGGSMLRYADDDAVATHRLLVQAGVDSTLLVRLDEDSRGLYPELGEHGLARLQDIDRAFSRAFVNIRTSTDRGKRAELLVFYSGHGDVDQGEGYVVLEDGRLTRSRLYSLLALSPFTFKAICLAGGLYLIYLGIMAVISRNHARPACMFGNTPDAKWQIYRQGVLTNLLNPKVALFFLAFLPQFIDPISNLGPLSFLFLGSVFLCTGTIWCLIVAISASAIADTFRDNTKIQRGFEYFTCILFVGLGISVLLGII